MNIIKSLIKPFIFIYKVVRFIVEFFNHCVKGLIKLKKRITTLIKVKDKSIKVVNLAGSGYSLYTKAEPFINSQLAKKKDDDTETVE